MCGLAGMLLPAPLASAEALQAQALAMGQALHHRGPDDGGSWVDADAGIALAHRRLSILDLSPLGHQPMASVQRLSRRNASGAEPRKRWPIA